MANWTIPEFRTKCAQYARAYFMIPWMIGDMCNQLEDVRGEEAWQYIDEIVEHMGISVSVLKDWMYVCDIFENEDRLKYRKSIWYFKEAASLGSKEGSKWVRSAIKNGWSYKELREKLRDARNTTS